MVYQTDCDAKYSRIFNCNTTLKKLFLSRGATVVPGSGVAGTSGGFYKGAA
jgi:hypothetical protein